MASWKQEQKTPPTLAAFGGQRLGRSKVAYFGTTRAYGKLAALGGSLAIHRQTKIDWNLKRLCKKAEVVMKKKITVSAKESSPSKEIDAIIANAEDWKGEKLARLRATIKKGYPAVAEEVKWKKPSRPEGVPVWSHNGNLCHADILKNAVRLTFHKGAQMKDPKKLFNTRLDSTVARGIDYGQEDKVNEAGLKALILEAVRVNESKTK